MQSSTVYICLEICAANAQGRIYCLVFGLFFPEKINLAIETGAVQQKQINVTDKGKSCRTSQKMKFQIKTRNQYETRKTGSSG